MAGYTDTDGEWTQMGGAYALTTPSPAYIAQREADALKAAQQAAIPTPQEVAVAKIQALDTSVIADAPTRELFEELRAFVAGMPTVTEQAAINVQRGIP